MASIIDTLVEMGFPRNRVELAVSKSNSKDIEAVTEWLLTHEEDEVSTPQTQTATLPQAAESEPNEELAALATSSQEPAAAKSIRCDDCGKLFKNQSEVEFHAAKSGHENFSESTEEKKPLTEEEKREQLEKIEAKLKQRRLEREEREKQEALEREKKRIRSGKDMLEAKQRQADLEMKKIVEARKREKEEDRLARQRVKDQIEQDRLARKAKSASESHENAAIPNPTTSTPAAPTPKVPANYNEVRLQIRLADGQQLITKFGAKEPLSAVRCYIQMNRPEATPFALMTLAPRKVFTDEDYEKPLDVLDLGPAAVLVVQKL